MFFIDVNVLVYIDRYLFILILMYGHLVIIKVKYYLCIIYSSIVNHCMEGSFLELSFIVYLVPIKDVNVIDVLICQMVHIVREGNVHV